MRPTILIRCGRCFASVELDRSVCPDCGLCFRCCDCDGWPAVLEDVPDTDPWPDPDDAA